MGGGGKSIAIRQGADPAAQGGEAQDDIVSPAPARSPARDTVKSTIYLPRALHTAVKSAAAGLGFNRFVVEALAERAELPRSGRPADPMKSQTERKRASRAEAEHLPTLRALGERLLRVERTLGLAAAAIDPEALRPLSVEQVRALVREVLIARGAPMGHRALHDHLVHERELALPGRDTSENLRTILVHPKSRGFRFVRGQGYWLDDRPVPGEPSIQD